MEIDHEKVGDTKLFLELSKQERDLWIALDINTKQNSPATNVFRERILDFYDLIGKLVNTRRICPKFAKKLFGKEIKETYEDSDFNKLLKLKHVGLKLLYERWFNNQNKSGGGDEMADEEGENGEDEE